MMLSLLACTRGSTTSPSSGSTVNSAISAHVVREPDVVRKDGNGLVGSASEYLREHDHDPVDWQPWTPATLARAVAEDKPIFLSIGYSACHFCHVMHDEVFVKDDVARVLNERFIAIKVDREERPDIDATYIAALEHMNGSAGWPATLFLTPTLDPFFGATYVEHDRFLQLSTKAADLYQQRDAGDLSSIDIRKILSAPPPQRGTALSADDLHAIAEAATGHLDLIHGGAMGRTKFPMVPRLEFLLHATRKWDLSDLTNGLKITLDAMMNGALRDPISGGFHRYTTDPDWTTPHYEIMLYDDAQLASLYFEAAAAMNEPRYAEVARGVLDFLITDMTVKDGACAASFDADTNGEEGAAWRWSASEIKNVVGDADALLVAAILDVGDVKVAPARRKTFSEIATANHVTEKRVATAWERARPLLHAARAGVARRDDKVVAAWNGLAIEAFSSGFLATGEQRYLDAATATGDAVWNILHKHGLTRTRDGVDAFTIDYADVAAGYLRVFEATNDLKWLTRVDALLSESANLEASDGGFYDGRSELAKTIMLDDGPEPSPTAAMLRVLVRRDTLSGADKFRAPITRAFTKYGNALREQSIGSAAWLDAALLDSGPSYDMVIAGTPDDAAKLTASATHLFPSWSVAVRVPPQGADATWIAALPSLAAKIAVNGRARAFVCQKGMCQAPTTEPNKLRDQLLTGWLH
jgi:uncharacterized protein YyaL (SSP411 family)